MKARKVSTIFWYPQTEWKLALSISGKGQQPPGQVLGCVLGPPHGSMQWPWTESSWLDSVQLSPSSSALGAGPVRLGQGFLWRVPVLSNRTRYFLVFGHPPHPVSFPSYCKAGWWNSRTLDRDREPVFAPNVLFGLEQIAWTNILFSDFKSNICLLWKISSLQKSIRKRVKVPIISQPETSSVDISLSFSSWLALS